MGKYEPCYLKSVVIVHGKSEKTDMWVYKVKFKAEDGYR